MAEPNALLLSDPESQRRARMLLGLPDDTAPPATNALAPPPAASPAPGPLAGLGATANWLTQRAIPSIWQNVVGPPQSVAQPPSVAQSVRQPARPAPAMAPAPAPAAPVAAPATMLGGSAAREVGNPFGSAPAPARQAPAPQAPSGGGLSEVFRDMTPEYRAAAMLHAIKRDWGGLAKLIAENPERKAAQEARGKATSEARAALPLAEQRVQSMTQNIDRVLADPNLGWITGRQADWNDVSGWNAINPLAWAGNIPAAIANVPNIGSGPDLADTRERIKQVQGQAFLEAYNAIRGAGAISDQEGDAAREAITRLGNLAQSDAAYVQALQDARREMHNFLNVARTKAGYAPQPYQPPSGAPSAGQGQGGTGNNDPLGIR